MSILTQNNFQFYFTLKYFAYLQKIEIIFNINSLKILNIEIQEKNLSYLYFRQAPRFQHTQIDAITNHLYTSTCIFYLIFSTPSHPNHVNCHSATNGCENRESITHPTFNDNTYFSGRRNHLLFNI